MLADFNYVDICQICTNENFIFKNVEEPIKGNFILTKENFTIALDRQDNYLTGYLGKWSSFLSMW